MTFDVDQLIAATNSNKARLMSYDLERLVVELQRDEGLRLKPYRDAMGKLTIGYGRNLDDKGIDEAEAVYLLHRDILDTAYDLDRLLPWWRTLSDARQRAILNMAFNLGIHGLLGFQRMLKALQMGDFATSSDEAVNSAWAKQVGSRANRIAKQLRDG